MKLFAPIRFRTTATALLLATCAAAPASAGSDSSDNLLQIVDTGADNMLTILQVSDNRGHLTRVTVSGQWNGAEIAGFKADPDWFTNGTPGLILQLGNRQTAILDVSGTGNLFSVVQSGESNVARGTISGIGNQAAISQAGAQNRAVFSQTGQNNHIAINQRM